MEAPSACTATGLQLAERLVRLVPDLMRNRIPASIGRKLSAAMDAADERLARKAALTAATAILDAGEGLCRWRLAQSLGSRLSRFAAVGYGRVKSGHRAANELEMCLIVLIETRGPRCASKLWEEMGALGLPE